MQALVKTYRKQILGLFIGMGVGWVYYLLIGCNSGSCAIGSNPWNSALYGGLVGVVAVGWPEKNKEK